jgi:choline dehydrogenase-like flavoprotein
VADPDVAIVGSGIVGATMAYLLTAEGHRVEVFEKGPAFAYPPARQLAAATEHLEGLDWDDLPADLQGVTQSGDYRLALNHERIMTAGGTATRWGGVVPRFFPHDFRTKTLYGYGLDWPIGYETLEPYYGRAEALLGVSGTDGDNPFAPPRSRPHPLPPFELSHDDRLMAGRLAERGIVLHSTPVAVARADYDGRPACTNVGVCALCPNGARYFPNHHLARVTASGRGTLHTGTSVRRIVLDRDGRARALVIRRHGSAVDEERPAKAIVVAGGAIESARLLLLSRCPRRPDGPGNAGGQVGQHLMFHHVWSAVMHDEKPLWPGRFGGFTGQSMQFCDPPGRGRVGGVKVYFLSPSPAVAAESQLTFRSGSDVIRYLTRHVHRRVVRLLAEARPEPGKHLRLSSARDRFGDPYAHAHYAMSEFDASTYDLAAGICRQIAEATRARDATMPAFGNWSSGSHHFGVCRMGAREADSVVDEHCRVHGVPNLYVVGGASFTSTSSVNPTLTMVALGVRAADHLAATLRSL